MQGNQEQMNTPDADCELDAQDSERASARHVNTIMVDNDMMKDVRAIRTILAKRNRLPTSSNAQSETLARHVPKDSGVSATRYHYKQPNEPDSEQRINDGECRRSQGDRFARGHSARFTELQAPPTSKFSSARTSSDFISRPSSQGTYPGSTTCANAIYA